VVIYAAVTTLYFRDSLHAIDKVKGVNLIYGIYDLGRTPSHRLATDSTFLSKKDMEEIMQLVFPGWTMEQKQDPHYSPLICRLAWITSCIIYCRCCRSVGR
jgi:hypothetical protein